MAGRRRALVIMAKEPTAGSVKTRLQPRLSPAAAAELYAGFLQDVWCVGAPAGVDLFTAYHPAPSRGWFERAAPAGCHLIAQRGGDLTERMEGVARDLFAGGYEAVVLRNSDSPGLPRSALAAAFEALDRHPVVLGPDAGGGYYLVGMCRPLPGLFDPIRAGEPVFERSLRWLAERGISPGLLSEETDVDVPADLDRLVSKVSADPTACPATRAVLDRLGIARDQL